MEKLQHCVWRVLHSCCTHIHTQAHTHTHARTQTHPHTRRRDESGRARVGFVVGDGRECLVFLSRLAVFVGGVADDAAAAASVRELRLCKRARARGTMNGGSFFCAFSGAVVSSCCLFAHNLVCLCVCACEMWDTVRLCQMNASGFLYTPFVATSFTFPNGIFQI